jgi:phosphatidate phosphatase APP1
MTKRSKYKHATVKVYHGYGHTHDLVVYGHVFKNKPVTRHSYTNNILLNIIHLLQLFFVKPVPAARVQLQWRNQVFFAETEDDGFFKFEWKSNEEVNAGWHPVVVNYLNEDGGVVATAQGKVFVPHSTQYAFISDIDDTVLISHSATIGKRLSVLFTKNPHTRKAFLDVVKHYELLAFAFTTAKIPNPFFYVSSSEWNLYDDLNDFFDYNKLPEGVFLLNQVKRWFQLLKTGKTKHEGKLLRVVRIIKTFPKQKFILFGDNSQSDPAIYASIVNKYPEKIFAVYIRNIRDKNEMITKEILSGIEKYGVYTCFFANDNEAMQYSKKIGLIIL